MKKPELLAPAGDLEKLKVAVAFGADAVYLGGKNYGLRAKAKNFEDAELEQGLLYAHERGVKVYVTVNIFAHNDDLIGLDEYLSCLEKLGIDGVLVSDPGIFLTAKRTLKHTEIHISTQANNTNYLSATFWAQQGAKRVVLARELSLSEIKTIREKIPPELELEAFVHGAMCISYSGRCLISNYMNGRNANKGECTHPCRFKYKLYSDSYLIEEETRPGELFPVYEDERGSYIFNSKDLCMIRYIPELLASGLDSLKIEGRMKTPYYVGVVVKAYREALDDYFASPALYESKKETYMAELLKTSHRSYTTGFYCGKPNENEHNYASGSYTKDWDFVGIVKGYDPVSGFALVEQRNKFVVGDTLDILKQKGENISILLEDMYTCEGIPVNAAPHAQQLLKIKLGEVQEFDMLRLKR